MADYLPWDKISTDESFTKATPEIQDQVRRRWLQNAIAANPDLEPEDQVRLTLRVYGQDDPKKSSEGIGGFIGQGAAKVGRTALKIADLPFVPLHYAREKVVKPLLEMIPGMQEPFRYQGVNEEKAATGIMHNNPNVQNIDQARMLRQLGMPAPADSIEQRTLGSRAEVLSHGVELAATGIYIKNVLGTLASKGITPAAQYINHALQDLGILEKWGNQKRAFEMSGRLLHSWEGKAQAMGSSVYNTWMKKVTDAQKRVDIRDFLEADAYTLSQKDPTTFAQKMSAFDQEQQGIVTWYLEREAARRQLGVDFKILRSPYDNYAPHIAKELEAGKSGVLFQLHRQKKLTMKEMDALGQNPFIEDIAIADAIHEVAFQRILGKKIFTSTLENLRAADGMPAVLTERTLDRLKLANPEIADTYRFSDPTKTRLASVNKLFGAQKVETVDKSEIEGSLAFFLQNQFVHKDFYKQVQRFLPAETASTKTGDLFRSILHGSRRLIMFNPLFHGADIATTTLAAAPWGNVLKAADFFGEGAKVKKLGLLGEEPYLSTILEGAHDGLNVPAISSTWHQMSQDMMKKVAGKSHFWTPLTEWNDKFLFDQIVSNPMYSVYKMVKDKWTPTLGAKEAGRVAAEYVNTAQGTLPIESFSPFMQKHGWWLLFSRGWTLSNFRSISASVGIPWGNRHISDVGQQALSREWAETWSRTMAYFNIQNEIANRFIAGHSASENPPGHEMDIDTGRYDKQGRRIYAAGAPLLAARQMVRRATNIAEGDLPGVVSDFYASLGVWKGLGEAAIGKDIFMNRDISKSGAPLLEQIGRRAAHGAAALTPFGTTVREGLRPGAEFPETVREIIDSPITWARFLTYWPTHGMTYHTDVFTRLKKADKLLILNSMSPEAKQGLIKGVSFGRIEGTAAVELKDVKDKITYLRENARDQAYAEVMRGDMIKAATILVKAGWSLEGARDFIASRGRKVGRLTGETE